jgi:glycosyltransferase involved in cell wall biosynthesis
MSTDMIDRAQAVEGEPSSQTADIVWITWEKQRRNVGLASALGVPLFELVVSGGRARRYATGIPRTLRLLETLKPRVVIVQNPSIILAAVAVMASRKMGFWPVVDAHNSGLNPLEGRSPVLRSAAAAIIRRAHVTVVSNRELKAVVSSFGGRGFVIPDRVPHLPEGRLRGTTPARHRILVVSTFARDEPYEAVISAAASLGPEVVLFITGRTTAQVRQLASSAPGNLVLTGYLPDEDYIGLLRASDAVVDLTNREACLVCGAYEAVAAARPMVLSDTEANRHYFRRGAVYTDNTPEGIAVAIRQAIDQRAELRAEVFALARELDRDFSRRIRHFRYYLDALVCSPRGAEETENR